MKFGCGFWVRVKKPVWFNPSYSQPEVDHWSWTDMSLVIFQREPDCIQISYSGGEMLKLNHQEGDGLLQ